MANGFIIALSLTAHLLAAATAYPQLHKHDTRIVGGEPAAEGELPYQVSLRTQNGNHVCGGSLVIVGDTQLILTKAGCVTSVKIWSVIAGDVKLSDTTGNEQSRQATRTIVHPDYDSWSYENDIALVFLDRPFGFNKFVAPIPLPRQGQQTTGEFILSGWGALSASGSSPNDILQKVQLPLVDHEVCERSYSDSEMVVSSTMFCTGLSEGGKDSCQGDNGGPVRSVEGGYLAGIISWGIGCAQAAYPSVNTEVSHFIDWIEGQVSVL